MAKLPPLTKTQRAVLKRLHNRAGRLQENKFVVEGYKSVADLLRSKVDIDFLVTSTHFLAKYPITLPPNTSVFIANPEQLQSLATLSTNEGILAVATLPPARPIELEKWDKVLVLDHIQNPGNLGAILRTAHWYGIHQLVASPDTVDLYNPKVIQASMGSFLAVSVFYTPLVPFVKNLSLPIIAAQLHGRNLHELALPARGCLVLGNESTGISADLLPYLTYSVTIPRYGTAESLNVAVAAGIICDRWIRSYE